MKERELKKLSRLELLEMLLELSRENDALTAQTETLRQELADRRIALHEAGSIAEAALSLSKVFAAAQEAADLYLENVRNLDGEAADETDSCQQRAQRMLTETQQTCDRMLAETKEKCDRMRSDTEAEIEKRWQQALRQIDTLHELTQGLDKSRGGAQEGEKIRG